MSWLEPSLGEGQTAAGKLQAIRAEAMAKGRAGSLGADVQPTMEDYARAGYREPNEPSRGGLTYANQTPELAAIQQMNAEWEANAPERELRHAITPEERQRDPAFAETAAGRLTEMAEVRRRQGEQDVQMELIKQVAGSGGTLDPEKAGQLQAIGVVVPSNLIGSSKDEALAFFDDAVQKGGSYLASRGPEYAGVQDPMSSIQKFGMMRAQYYRQMVEAGQMNNDDAIYAWKNELAQMSMAQGIMNELGQLTIGAQPVE
jgi:hypothetical protein